jgi:aryl-alcohol dehydrogenase-like predicted oxidoreductase/adenylate kinase family enzyme
MIGLGCMRLSTAAGRDDANGIAVIHAALAAGATLLDTADAYCLNEEDAGHNERLIASALRTWEGDRTGITVATKGGLRRPGGRWIPDGRASHLKAACDASRRALGVDVIDLYQLHTVDPRTPLETSVRALAALQRAGAIRRIGLCNVNVAQIEAARVLADIAAVQVSVGVADEENLRNGVAEYCAQHGIMLIAYRPLGGERAARLAKDPALAAVAARHGLTPQEVALAWLRDLAPHIVPIPGATTVAHAQSLARVLALHLDDSDRAQLDARFTAARLLRQPRAARRPASNASGDVVLIMGMPGAGKSTLASEYVARGYARLNRDDAGGTLSDIAEQLERELANGRTQHVLDNTYAARAARSRVIESAWQHNVPVRCVWLKTSLADAQINAIGRLLDAHGHLPTPEELRAHGKTDHRFFGPDAQFRYERQLEAPSLDEGFRDIDVRTFQRREVVATRRAIVLEFDDVLVDSVSGRIPDDRGAVLRAHHAEGCLLAAIAWRPHGAADITAAFDRVRAQLAVPIALGYCPHPAGPPICWCRKPLPGLVLELLHGKDVHFERSVVVGRAAADRTLAKKLGMHYSTAEVFFDAG